MGRKDYWRQLVMPKSKKLNIDVLRLRPIPNIKNLFYLKKERKEKEIDDSDSRFKEKLLNIKNFKISGSNHYYCNMNPPYYRRIPGSIPNLLARETVVKKLMMINSKLDKLGLEVFVFDAYRPLAVQNFFYFKWFPDYFRKKYPGMTDEWIMSRVSKYWSAGAKNLNDLKKNIPPHLTGGALDLSLRYKKTGLLFEMGSIFDDISKVAHLDYYEKKQKKGLTNFTEEEALGNRRLLFHIMTDAGFAPNPNEWWHFSYGDQMWAAINQEDVAFYGHLISY